MAQKEEPRVFPVWVGNLAVSVDDQALLDQFGSCGNIDSHRLTLGRGQSNPRKFAFVNYTEEEAQTAACEFDNTEFQGTIIQVKKRERKSRWEQIFIGGLDVVDEDELKSELEKLDPESKWNIKGLRVREGTGSKYAFVFFNTLHEANIFYDDLHEKTIKGSKVNVEFPRTNEEREAIRLGMSNQELERVRRTVFVSSINKEISREQIKEYCREFGEVISVSMPKSNDGSGKNKGFAFAEFKRKTDADVFVGKVKEMINPMMCGSPFKAEIRKLNLDRLRSEHDGFGGRGGFGGPYGGAPPPWMQWYNQGPYMGGRGRGGGRGWGAPRGGPGRGGGFGRGRPRGGSRGGWGNQRGGYGNNYRPY